MAKWREKLEQKIGGGPGGPNRMNTFRWIIVAGGIGAIIMIVSSFLTVKEVSPYDSAPLIVGTEKDIPAAMDAPAFQSKTGRESMFAEFEASYENNIKEMLQKIVGVGEVQVMVTIDSTEEMVAERNVTESQQVTDEKDPGGATRHITQTSRTGQVVMYGDGQAPIVRKTIRPPIRGVLIVAEGAENVTVKKLIAEAVERGLGVPAHRISIAPSKR